MSNNFVKLIATGLLCSSAMAAQYVDFDVINAEVTPEQYITGSFNLLTSGIENDSGTFAGYDGEAGGNGTFNDVGGFTVGSIVQDATLAFWFSDPNGGTDDGYKIRIKVSTYYSTIEQGAALDTEKEYQSVLVNNWWPEHVTEIFYKISTTGILDYKIATSGTSTFHVDAGMLIVNTPDGTSRVPDGGSTAVLLGLGMVGLVGLQRKLRK
jgi:hypothetical protein